MVGGGNFLLVAMVKNAEIGFLSTFNFSYHAGIQCYFLRNGEMVKIHCFFARAGAFGFVFGFGFGSGFPWPLPLVASTHPLRAWVPGGA